MSLGREEIGVAGEKSGLKREGLGLNFLGFVEVKIKTDNSNLKLGPVF